MWPTTDWRRPLKNTFWVSDAPLSYQSIRRFSVSIKLLVTDIDRTLVNSPHCASPSPRNIAALRAASEQGVTVAIASGRNQASCRTFAQELGLACPILANNGAEVFDGRRAALPQAPECSRLLLRRGVRPGSQADCPLLLLVLHVSGASGQRL